MFHRYPIRDVDPPSPRRVRAHIPSYARRRWISQCARACLLFPVRRRHWDSPRVAIPYRGFSEPEELLGCVYYFLVCLVFFGLKSLGFYREL